MGHKLVISLILSLLAAACGTETRGDLDGNGDTTPTPEPTPTPAMAVDQDNFLVLDFDLDRRFTPEDAREVLRFATGISACPADMECDHNGDGAVSAADALFVLQVATDAYDCDGDGTVTAADEAAFPVGEFIEGALGPTFMCDAGKICDVDLNNQYELADHMAFNQVLAMTFTLEE